MLNNAKPNQTKTTEITNKDNNNEKVDSLDFLLEKDKLENKFNKKDN